jgi:hypothetical protein
MQGLVRRLMLGGLVLLLSGCVALGAPSKTLIQQALQLQVEQTQASLSQQLKLTPPQVEIRKLRVGDRSRLRIGDLPAYRIQGQFDLQLHQGRRQQLIKRSPFELYVQRQPEGKTWRLAVPAGSTTGAEQDWRTYALPLPTER